MSDSNEWEVHPADDQDAELSPELEAALSALVAGELPWGSDEAERLLLKLEATGDASLSRASIRDLARLATAFEFIGVAEDLAMEHAAPEDIARSQGRLERALDKVAAEREGDASAGASKRRKGTLRAVGLVLAAAAALFVFLMTRPENTETAIPSVLGPSATMSSGVHLVGQSAGGVRFRVDGLPARFEADRQWLQVEALWVRDGIESDVIYSGPGAFGEAALDPAVASRLAEIPAAELRLRAWLKRPGDTVTVWRSDR